jgi:hypothetical protein
MPDVGIAHPVLAGRLADPHRGILHFRACRVNNRCLIISSRPTHRVCQMTARTCRDLPAGLSGVLIGAHGSGVT